MKPSSRRDVRPTELHEPSAEVWAAADAVSGHDGGVAIPGPGGQPADPARLEVLLRSLEAYRAARVRLLEVLDLAVSNRDPLAEFSEHLVQALLGGKLASSRVQKGYDLTIPSGERVQVRYLANPGAVSWVNEHNVRC